MKRRRASPEEELRQWEERVYRKCLLFGHWSDVDTLYPRAGESVEAAEMAILVRDVRKKGARMEEIVLSDETQALVEKRAEAGCASCIYIASDFRKNGKLTDYPGNYPVEAKIGHVQAEKEGTVA